MKTITKSFKESPIWLITLLISIISIIFFIYLPFQINLFPENVLKKVYYVDNISEAHLKIINKFNEEYRNKIEVVPVDLPFYYFTTNDRKAVLTRSLRNRSDGIDIFAVDLIWIKRFAKWGYPIDSRIKQSMLRDVNPMALRACYQNDSLVAFPLFLDIGVLYYRKDLINKLPDGSKIEKMIQRSLTWNEFADLGMQFKNSSNPYYVFTGGDFEGLMCCFQEMLSQDESREIFYNNPIELNRPASRRALQKLVDFIYKYKFTPKEAIHFDDPDCYSYANEHDAVFFRGWTGYHKQYKWSLEDTSKIEKMGIAPLPHIDGHNSSGVFGGWSLMISKFSTRKEEALKFIDYMFRKENQKILYEEGGYIPINDEVYSDSLYIKKHAELAHIHSLLSWGKHRPFLDNYTRLSEILTRSIHNTLKGDTNVEKALQQATEIINTEKAIVK